MDLATIFELPANFDPEPIQSSAKRLLATLQTDAVGLTKQLLLQVPLGEQSVALANFVLGGKRREVDDALRAVHPVVLLTLAVRQQRELLLKNVAPDALEHDLKVLVEVARGERHEGVGPISKLVADLRGRMAQQPGWDDGRTHFEAALLSLIDGFDQEYRMRAHARDSSLGPLWQAASLGGGIDLMIEAACIALGDETRRRSEMQADLVSRLAGAVVGLSSDLTRQLKGQGTPEAKELITQRFGVAAHVIKLDPPEIARALRATTELEIRDLLDATRYLEPDQPRGMVVRRTVAATLQMQGAANAIVDVMRRSHPSRNDLMKQMRDVATENGTITTDERALLRGMDKQLFAFQSLLDRTDEDRVVDFREFEEIRSSRMQVLDDLFRIALEDAQITDEERNLLLRALELVPTLRS